VCRGTRLPLHSVRTYGGGFMKTLIRSLFVAVALVVASSTAPLAAQRVWVDVRIGTPGYQYREYHSGHRWYRQHRQYHRSYGWRYSRPVVIVRPYWEYRRPVVVYRSHRARRHNRWH
jgi:hypothetical protein